MGVPLEFILENEPCELWIYDDAYIVRVKEEDARDYRNGIYTFEAFGRVLANAFRSKGKESIGYLEEPLLKDKFELTETEKAQQIDLLFSQLATMQANFESNRG